MAFLLRALGGAARQMSRVLIRLYDVAIVVPLLAERFMKGARSRGSRDPSHDVDIDLERTHA
jgi:hypothetical protein